MVFKTILDRVRFSIATCLVLVCSSLFAGDPEFGSAMAWGKLQMFKADDGKALQHRTFDPQRQEWSDWQTIANIEITSAPTAVLTDEGSRLAVYFRGKDGRLQQVYRDRDGGWSRVWTFGDRTMDSGPTALIVDGTLTVFARSTGGGLMKIYYDKPLGSWTKWIDVDPPIERVGKLAGEWAITYSHGAMRSYIINDHGKVTAKVDHATLTGQITLKDGQHFLEFEGDGKLERLTLRQDDRLFVEHYNPKSDFLRARPTVTGNGLRQKTNAVVMGWESKVVSIGNDEQAATKKYNELKKDGWELEGPLGNGMVAFKRPTNQAKMIGTVPNRVNQSAAAVKAPQPLEGEYFIESALKAGQLIDVWSAKTDPGTRIQLGGPGDQRNRRWRLIPMGGDEYLIETVMKRNLVLEVPSEEIKEGVRIQMGDSTTPRAHQRWKLIRTGNNGEYAIESAATIGMGLDVIGKTGADYSPIQLGEAGTTANNRWRLIRVDLGK
jgi:hypothetical protein